VLPVLGLTGLYVVVVPSMTPVTPFDLYNDKRLLQTGLLIVAAGTLLAFSPTRRRWLSAFRSLPFSARWGLCTALGLGLISAAMAPAPGYAFLEVGHLVLLFALAGIIAAAVRCTPEYTEVLLLGAVVLSAGLYAVHFGVSYGLSVAWPALEVGRETISGFGNIRHFNQYQTWTLPLLGGAVLALPRRWRAARCSVFGLVALWWTLVLASNVRGTMVAMGIASVIVWGLFRQASHRWLGVQGMALLAGGGLYVGLFSLMGGPTPEVVDRLAKEGGYAWRLQRWTTCLEMVFAHPWLGAGPMHFAWAPFRIAPGAHPHNAVLQWAAEWGVLSTLIMSGLVTWGGGRWLIREMDEASSAIPRSNAVRIGLVVAVLAGAAHAMVSGLLVTPVSQIFLALVGGWAWGRYQHDRASPTVPSRSARLVLCVVLIGAIGIVGERSLRDLSTVEERQSAFMEATDRLGFSPRYWQQGYIGVRDSSVIERARRDQ
jgi:O-antigen ligase